MYQWRKTQKTERIPLVERDLHFNGTIGTRETMGTLALRPKPVRKVCKKHFQLIHHLWFWGIVKMVAKRSEIPVQGTPIKYLSQNRNLEQFCHFRQKFNVNTGKYLLVQNDALQCNKTTRVPILAPSVAHCKEI